MSRQLLLPFSDFAITSDRFVEWAEDRVRRHPTYEENVWNAAKVKFETVTKTNSVEHELAELLLRHNRRNYADYDHYELLEAITDFVRSGTKGLDSYTREELLAEIMDEVVEPYLENAEEPGTWEDLLADRELFGRDD